jgi:hypothetical protein
MTATVAVVRAVIRVVLLIVAAVAAPIIGFLVGVVVAIELADRLPGVQGDGAVPALGPLGAIVAYMAWFRLLRQIHWWQLDRMRRTAVEVTAIVSGTDLRQLFNPRGPNSNTVTLLYRWSDPRNGSPRAGSRSYQFPDGCSAEIAEFHSGHHPGSALKIWVRPRLRTHMVDVPVLPIWWNRW